MNNEKLNHLKKLAERATPGEWITGAHRHDPAWVVLPPTEDSWGFCIAQCQIRVNGFNNASYIAAANPNTILQLIASIETLANEINLMNGKFIEDGKASIASIEFERELAAILGIDAKQDEKLLRSEILAETAKREKQMVWLLTHIDTADGISASKSLNPDNKPEKIDIDAIIKKFDSLAVFYTWLAVEVVRLNKEATWLAQNCQGENQCPYLAFYRDLSGNTRPKWCDCLDNGEEFDCDEYAPDCWRKAAREAVEKENEAHKSAN